MKYPAINNIVESKEVTTYFQGYNHTLSCPEGAFFDATNITTSDYPILSARPKRGINKTFTKLQGILDKENLIWVDNGTLYIDNVAKTGPTLTSTGEKTITKMGAYIVIMPDKVWYNVEDNTYGNMEAKFTKTISTTFSLCAADGKAITYHDEAYYTTHEAADGDYMIYTNGGKSALKVYSGSTSMWMTVTTTYMQISATGIGSAFEKGDGVKITVDLNGKSWDDAANIFVNVDGTKRYSTFVIYDKTANSITVPALLNANKTISLPITVAREVPNMSFITECQNRLWGCATDGHEVYCCKLGDVKNWNCFAGIATDSWAATVGTDGKFTGAYSYLGYPLFFKEDSILRVAISSVGAHQTKSISCRGVQSGSEKSLCMVNELLYYKSGTSICTYDGQFPNEISEALGVDIYKNATAGTIDGRYYINMEDAKGNFHTFVYNAAQKLWAKEDDIKITAFCKHADELYFVADDNKLYSVGGTNIYGATQKEKDFEWSVTSGPIGYATNNKKHVSRLDIRLTLGLSSYVSLLIQYDSTGPWISMWQMYGRGTKTFAIPLKPHRCDHFRYKLVGKGEANLISLTKNVAEGSDN